MCDLPQNNKGQCNAAEGNRDFYDLKYFRVTFIVFASSPDTTKKSLYMETEFNAFTVLKIMKATFLTFL